MTIYLRHHQAGLQHISVALNRVRYQLARWIAPADQLFNPDMSQELDRLVVENEDLRAAIWRLTSRVIA